MFHKLRLSGLVVLGLIALCTPGRAADSNVLVFAAASTRDAMDAAIAAWRGDRDVQVHGVYASSAALARQIQDGAPAALYLSANIAWMNAVAGSGLLSDRNDYLHNRLVLIANREMVPSRPVDSAGDIAILLGNDRLALAETTGAPAGIYARTALETLGAWDSLRGRLAEMSNVRGALFMVERGEAPFGVVYRTDALASSGVEIIWAVPGEAHPPVIYQLALLSQAADNPDAVDLFRFLQSPDGQRFFTDRGFGLAG
ncbi:MAG: molybdate ABC transporter substrate-binding protein [Alphaproteobacteria bacterium]|nr:molybdate ABC transporter substrate-binding protein [Alphaproteobacteria bacterium]